QLPPWKWIPCETGTVGCEQLDYPKYTLDQKQGALNLLEGSSNSRFLVIGRFRSEDEYEQDVYDILAQKPVAAWRYSIQNGCWITVMPTETGGTLLFLKQDQQWNNTSTLLASGSFSTLGNAPKFQALQPNPVPGQASIDSWAASDDRIALNIR